MALERLQKLISKAGICSRRAAEQLILDGRISVDGIIVKELGVKADSKINTISFDGKPIFSEKKVYLLFYKPENVITSMYDPEGRPVVTDYINIKERVYPVGRLDFDAEGLLILTNDGEFANKLIHPRYKVKKSYRVKVKGKISESSLDRIRSGISYKDIEYQPATIDIIKTNRNTAWLDLVIKEGKNHQVKNMLAAIGLEVLILIRKKIAFLNLNGLKKGEFRELTEKEILSLTKRVF